MTEDLPNQEEPKPEEEREALENRLIYRLSQLDDGTLRQLDQWLETATEPIPQPAKPSTQLSRRQFIGGLAVGSVLLIASNTATALISLNQGTEKGDATARAELTPQLARLRELIQLYQRLEDVGLDDIVRTGLGAIGLLLGTLREGARILKMGLDIAEAALVAAEGALLKLQEGYEFVKGLVEAVEKRIAALWSLLGEVTGVAIPIAESVGAFFKSILEKIPFGIGAKIQQVIEEIEGLIAQLPEALAHLKARLLGPLQAEWLDAEGGNGLQARLITPVREKVLDPARQLVAEIEALDSKWGTQLQEPVEKALQERATIRAEIASYRSTHHLA